MKFVKRIMPILALMLIVCCTAACGGKTSGGAPENGASVSQAEADASLVGGAENKGGDSKANKQEKTTQKPTTTEAFRVNRTGAVFAMGAWNDGDDLEYMFKSSGNGTIKHVSQGKSESFFYEINEKKQQITFHIGEDGKKKETATYTITDETHIVLKYSGQKTVSLTFGALLTKDSAPFAMGTWKSDTGEIEYVFRLDGSGLVRNVKSGTELPFQYEVNPSTALLIFHMGSADDESAAVYTKPDSTHLNIIFDTGSMVSLELKGKEK